MEPLVARSTVDESPPVPNWESVPRSPPAMIAESKTLPATLIEPMLLATLMRALEIWLAVMLVTDPPERKRVCAMVPPTLKIWLIERSTLMFAVAF